MRQGVITNGKWTGNPSGGVTAPVPIILPAGPAARFARTSARLEALSEGHAMADYLRFMARLSAAQSAAATTGTPLPRDVVEQAASARVPPLEGRRRGPEWRDGLGWMLEVIDTGTIPAPARAVIADLRGRSGDALDALADDFLEGGVDAGDAGAAVYVAAALQVYFTGLAAALPLDSLRLLPQRGRCPCCGSPPVSGVVSGSSAARYLYCSLCGTGWNHVRAVCITCGGSRAVALRGIDGDAGTVKAETCDDCKTYAKVLYQSKDMDVDPVADDLATIGLDMLVAEAGWSRHAPNPMLLIRA